jgi:hypothetical protein
MDRRFEDHSRSLHREDGEIGPSHLHIRNGPRFRTLDPGYGRQTNPPKVAGPFARASIWSPKFQGRVAHLCIAPLRRRVPHPCVFLAREGRDAAGATCPFYTTRRGCRRRTRPSQSTRRTGHPLLWWLLQLESRATPSAPNLRFPERTGAALRLDLAHDNHQNSNLLFGLRQLRNNCGNFIEYLVPALHLTAILCALHGFISNEGEFRLAVSQILKDGHVVRTVDSLMFYS